MRKAIFAGALLLVAAAISIASQAGSASATTSTVKVQLTKWVLEPTDPAGLPWEMRGVITGGDLGKGEYTGRVVGVSGGNGQSAFNAIYNFAAGGRSFTARVVYTQDDATLAATVSGEVTDGDFKGAKVSGTAQGYPQCPILTPGNAVAPMGDPNVGLCFWLDLQIETPPAQPSITPPQAGDAGLVDATRGGSSKAFTVAGLGAVFLLTLGAACRLRERL